MKGCPTMEPRLPYDETQPKGMLESDRDFVSHNRLWLHWCERNASLVSAAPELLKALKKLRDEVGKSAAATDSITDRTLELVNRAITKATK